VVSDVFDSLVGQDRAVTALRRHARSPVHAYLFTGPAGSNIDDAVVAFAAALQCPDFGCGHCEACRKVLARVDPDVHLAQRAGVSWRVDDLREIDRISRRRPLGSGYQIMVVPDVELTVAGTAPSAPALLKSLEEPPTRTIFVLTAEDVPDALDTVVSRCVEVKFRAMSDADLEEVLRRDGVAPEVAAAAARSAGGNVTRARVLVRDPGLGQRLDAWRAIPERLTGTAAGATQIADEIGRAIDAAMTPLETMHVDELARRTREAKDVGLRSVGNRKEIEAHFKREERRFRVEELRFGLSVLTNVYRDRMVAALHDVDGSEGPTEGRSHQRVASSLTALDVLHETNERLGTNIDESLLLTDLMLSLSRL
jgi:DNA polymerase III subunit delta'